MKGLLADVNAEGHLALLIHLFRQEPHQEFWTYLALSVPRFSELGLVRTASDLEVWNKCQSEELVLLTSNRKDEGPDALQSVIRTHNTPTSLPVLTMANAERLLQDRSYAERTADTAMEYLIDIDRYLGAGRLWIP